MHTNPIKYTCVRMLQESFQEKVANPRQQERSDAAEWRRHLTSEGVFAMYYKVFAPNAYRLSPICRLRVGIIQAPRAAKAGGRGGKWDPKTVAPFASPDEGS
eukprot:3120751-Pyramimonas_sp.AAC.1